MNIFDYIKDVEDEKPLDRIAINGGFCGIFRTIGCIGDSLSSGELESMNADGTKGYHDMFEYSWGQFMARNIGSTVYNFSRGGMTAKEYVESFADYQGFWNPSKACQAYIIALGVNDIINANRVVGSLEDVCKEDYTKNKDTFAGYYAQIIQRLKKMQPRAKFFLMSTPRHDDENDEKRKQIRDLLEDFTKYFDDTYLLDFYTYAPVQDKAFYEKFWLGHLTPTGYILTARMVESYMDYIIRKNPQDFKQVGFIGTDLYYNQE
jgi:lysophospholipase L1-like esterase